MPENGKTWNSIVFAGKEQSVRRHDDRFSEAQRIQLMDKKLDLQTIKKHAPSRAWERGYDYYQSGLVSSVKEYKGVISAKVKGQQTYTVRLPIEVDDDFDYSCTCPMGDEGEFCKHCVAVALTWINRNEKKNSTKQSYEVTLKDIEHYLNTRDKTMLVEMLMEQVQDNEMLFRKLGFQAAQAISGAFNETAWMKMIRNAFEVDDYIDYREMYQYMENISDVVDSLEDLFEKGAAKEVIGLAEYALHQAEEAVESIDDSDGQMGEVIEDLHEIHFRACEEVKPDPQELAARFFEMELNSEWDIFYGAAKPTPHSWEKPDWLSIVVWPMKNGKRWIGLLLKCGGLNPILRHILFVSRKRWRNYPAILRNWWI